MDASHAFSLAFVLAFVIAAALVLNFDPRRREVRFAVDGDKLALLQ